MATQQNGRRIGAGREDRSMRRDEWRPEYEDREGREGRMVDRDEAYRTQGRTDRDIDWHDESYRTRGRSDRDVGWRDRDEGYRTRGRFDRELDSGRFVQGERWDERGPEHFGYGRGDQMGYSRSYGQSERVGYGTQGFGSGNRSDYGEYGGYDQGRGMITGYGRRGYDTRGPYGQDIGYGGSREYGRWSTDRDRESGMRGQEIGGHRGKGPRNFTRSDDRIREIVSEALSDDDRIDATNIDVAVRGGEVTLTGTVDDRRTKRLVEDVVEDLVGVKELHNQIKVQAEKGDGSREQSRGTEAQGSERRTGTSKPS
jgi:hypothetical protein